MDILIIGGAGFVGESLAQRISMSSLSSRLVIVDRDAQRLSRMNDLSSSVVTRCFDSTDVGKLKQVFEEFSFSVVFHLAANSDIKSGSTSPNADFNDTFKTSVALAEILRFHDIDALFFSSSSAVYGELDSVLDSELELLRSPISSYGWAKLGSEMILSEASRRNQFRFINMRFPNVIGGNPTHGILFDMKKKLELNRNYLQVLGDGSQTKPYIHIDELITIIMRLVLETKTFYGDWNVGPADTISVKRIVELILAISKLSPEVVWGNQPAGWPGDVTQYAYTGSLPNECQGLSVSPSELAVRKSVQKMWWP